MGNATNKADKPSETAPRILEDVSAPATEVVAEETKAEAFSRLANLRVNKLLDQIRKLGNLSAKGNYEYTEEQVARIRAAVDAKLDQTFAKFAPRSIEKDTFQL